MGAPSPASVQQLRELSIRQATPPQPTVNVDKAVAPSAG